MTRGPKNSEYVESEVRPLSQWITGSEAARILGVSVQSVRLMGIRGYLVTYGTRLGTLYNPENVQQRHAERQAKERSRNRTLRDVSNL